MATEGSIRGRSERSEGSIRLRSERKEVSDVALVRLEQFYSFPEEQLKRFAARLDDPDRNWKISESDYTERELWESYMEAFQDALRLTSTKEAPWYVVPSDRKWFRDLVIAKIIADTLEDMNLKIPAAKIDLEAIRRKYHAAKAEQKQDDKRHVVPGELAEGVKAG